MATIKMTDAQKKENAAIKQLKATCLEFQKSIASKLPSKLIHAHTKNKIKFYELNDAAEYAPTAKDEIAERDYMAKLTIVTSMLKILFSEDTTTNEKLNLFYNSFNQRHHFLVHKNGKDNTGKKFAQNIINILSYVVPSLENKPEKFTPHANRIRIEKDQMELKSFRAKGRHTHSPAIPYRRGHH